MIPDFLIGNKYSFKEIKQKLKQFVKLSHVDFRP